MTNLPLPRIVAILCVFGLTLASAYALLLGLGQMVGLCAGLLLLFALPGAALLLALPADLRPRDPGEVALLAAGLSVALAMYCFWAAAQLSGLGVITRWLVVESFVIGVLLLIGLWQVWRSRRAALPEFAAPQTSPQFRTRLGYMA